MWCSDGKVRYHYLNFYLYVTALKLESHKLVENNRNQRLLMESSWANIIGTSFILKMIASRYRVIEKYDHWMCFLIAFSLFAHRASETPAVSLDLVVFR